jgi:anti-sigma B factor antagonist
MTAPFRVEIQDLDGNVRVASVTGELDMAAVPKLEQTLSPVVEEGLGSLLIDLSDCEFMDSSGLASLVAARERLTATDGREFAVCCPDSQVRRLLQITGLDEAMSLTDSRDEALAALRDGASAASA